MDVNEKRTRKRASNRSRYLADKTKHDAVLLRLDKGDLARLDHARAKAALSRSAFAKLYLLPLADVVAANLPALERARRAQNITLATLLEQALALAARAPRERELPELAAASEFDALFGAEPAS